MKRAILLLLFIFALGLVSRVVGQATPAKPVASAISGDWAIGSIRNADVTPAQVKSLLEAAEADGYDVGDVCDYSFADIAGDGFYRLIVTVDVSGRRFCNNLEIISNDGTVQHIDAWLWDVGKAAALVVKGDGHEDLRVPQTFTDYEGANSCIAVIPIYYRFSGGKFVPAITEHAEDYQALRERLSSSPPADMCDEIEADKVNRLLGDKTAGFSHAEAWMTSSDPLVREKAVRVFQDIGDAASKADLKVLATDKDPGVAMAAGGAVQQ